MQFRPRNVQTSQPTSYPHTLLKTASVFPVFTDAIYDTPALPRSFSSLHWTHEAKVHGGLLVTRNLKNTNQFASTQVMAVRDEVRRLTHFIAIENDGLYRYVYDNDAIKLRLLVASGDIRRAHLALRKFDGVPVIAYVVARDGAYELFLNDTAVPTTSQDIDFPFLAIHQATMGNPAVIPPADAVLFYKDRGSNQILSRRIDPVNFTMEAELNLGFPATLGGADGDITSTECIVRAQVFTDAGIRSHIVRSSDFGHSFSAPAALDLSFADEATELPASAPVMADNTYNFHVPVLLSAGEETTLVDVMPNDDLAVAAIAEKSGTAHSLVRFPSMGAIYSPLREGFGDGLLDGSGVIATLLSAGKLLASNSQSGGYTYPSEAHLNYEMQRPLVFRATECYTRGTDANIVSMDYLIAEADEDGRAISSDLWIDTWDMPLPVPIVTHSFDGTVLTIRIERSGWFFHGQTHFEITPANTFITKAEMNGFREVKLEFDDPTLVSGCEISFETKNVFYHYGAKVRVK